MKKLLLATAISAASFVSLSAEAGKAASPAGKGFYICPQLGGGALILSGDGKFYKKDSDGALSILDEAKESIFIGMPSFQLNWGYSHRFLNDMTLGFEANLISPAIRFGYMVQDQHHISMGLHYALITQLMLSVIVDQATEYLYPADIFSLKTDGLSGVGASLSYEYFTASKNFIRAQFRVDYYGLEGKVGTVRQLSGNSMLPFGLDGKGSAWDVYLSVGFGSQW